MPPRPFRPRDIVRVFASVDRTLHNFFFDNSHLPTASEVAGTNKSSSRAPTILSPPNPKGGPIRPGVILDVSRDYASIAVFTTLQGKALSNVTGPLRHVIATIRPANNKYNAAASGWLHSLAVYPTWRNPEAAEHTYCLCLKQQVPISRLNPWSWKDEPTLVGKDTKMCSGDFRILQQLCERNERLRGLFKSEIRWLFEELSLDDIVSQCDWMSKKV